MQQDQLNPGDRVIELAALAQSAAVVAGAMSAAVGARLARLSWPAALGALVGGGLLGFFVGLAVGRALYRTAEGQTTVARVGRAAFPAALPAGFAGGLASALASAGLSVFLLAAPSQPVLIAAVSCGLLAGLLLSCLASLT